MLIHYDPIAIFLTRSSAAILYHRSQLPTPRSAFEGHRRECKRHAIHQSTVHSVAKQHLTCSWSREHFARPLTHLRIIIKCIRNLPCLLFYTSDYIIILLVRIYQVWLRLSLDSLNSYNYEIVAIFNISIMTEPEISTNHGSWNSDPDVILSTFSR